MVSLRARLIAGLLALAAVGLLVLAGVTYAEQSRFLNERVDDQARARGGLAERLGEAGRGARRHGQAALVSGWLCNQAMCWRSRAPTFSIGWSRSAAHIAS